MKKTLIIIVPALLMLFFSVERVQNIWSQNKSGSIAKKEDVTINLTNKSNYKYPEFYRGIYLTSESGSNLSKLSFFVKKAKESNINAMVIDIQNSRMKACVIPKENVDYCLKNGIHPIARIVVFPDGLRKFPVSAEAMEQKMKLAETACDNGFKEIQFDYIRFNDHGILRHLTLQEKYKFIEGFLEKAKLRLKSYSVKIAADVFGRIPLNTKDEIGQRMEGLDRVADIICPMAYPSHYTWSKHLMSDPYHTVFITSKKARERCKNAEIVTYIQAFKMKLGYSGMTFEKYIQEQIRATHDAGIRGYLLWNASQEYEVPFAVVKNYYSNKNISQSDTKKRVSDKEEL